MAPPVSPAAPDDRPAACRLLAAGRPAPLRDDAARRFLDLLTSGEFDPAGLFVARGAGGTVRGAVLAQAMPGALGVLFPPRTFAGREADADPLLAAALDWLRGRGVKVCQSFAPAGDCSDEPTLARASFRHVTAVVHMHRAIDPVPAEVGPLTFEPHAADPPAFAAALLASHDGSLDCPELTGARTPAELLDGFRGPPVRPGWWALARHGGEPAGVVMLDAGTEVGAVDLNYLGLVPAARGKGWGAELLRFALRAAAADGARALTLSVDARNAPARRLYERHGFREADRREVYLWADPGPT